MCGIVGAVSGRNIVPILVQGLQRLEYRGYDSCGVAVNAAQAQMGQAPGLQRDRYPSPAFPRTTRARHATHTGRESFWIPNIHQRDLA